MMQSETHDRAETAGLSLRSCVALRSEFQRVPSGEWLLWMRLIEEAAAMGSRSSGNRCQEPQDLAARPGSLVLCQDSGWVSEYRDSVADSTQSGHKGCQETADIPRCTRECRPDSGDRKSADTCPARGWDTRLEMCPARSSGRTLSAERRRRKVQDDAANVH